MKTRHTKAKKTRGGRHQAATIAPMAKVNNKTEALKQTDLLIERQSELAAGIRELGSPDLEPLARSLEDAAREAGEAAKKVRPLEDAETMAIRRVRNGQVTGSTSIEDFADEYDLTESDLTR